MTAAPAKATDSIMNAFIPLNHDDLACAIERLPIGDPQTLSALDHLPANVFQHLADHLLGESCSSLQDASLLSAAEKWNAENPEALPILERLPGEVLQHIVSHVLGDNSEISGENEQCTTKQVTLDQIPGLATLERLPTEIIQNIADGLLRDHTANANTSRYDGFLEFRSVSCTIRAKTEYLFVRSFDAHTVGVSQQGILELLELSEDEAIRGQVHSLVFVASKHCKEERRGMNFEFWQRHSRAIELPEVKKLLF
ncbi:hypothetical protein EK21DRAFT_106559 [Setomelanomma holmii]|uniref:Uncharacterized protein n=1 Tax=Setomelanomma holmii TaxID=210430 RepID=A0A9P4HJH8_9PLEO|nr:hypothetical protein EK21DRAFT_106559 [Setomelanomma holmii]